MATILFDDALRNRVQENLQAFERTAIPADGLARAAVAFVLVGTAEGEAAFILTRRPLRLRRHAGQWALPGGRCDEGESASETALREVEEEVGLALERTSAVALLDDFRTRSGFVITPVVVWGPRSPTLKPDPNEVHSAHLVPIAALDVPGVPNITTSKASDRPLISIRVASLGTTIWAPTAALLYQTREVVLHGRATRVAHFEQPRFAWS